jgi:hypothetical protein
MQSAYHNLPTIGGEMQHDGSPYAATDVKYATNDSAVRIAMNLATAYPPDASVKRWMREVALDRKASVVRVTEEFELAKSAPVALSFMSSRIPADGKGEVTFRSEKAGVKDVRLKYDAAALRFNVEKIALADPGMQRSWGPALYRVQLKTVSDVTKGRWMFEIG